MVKVQCLKWSKSSCTKVVEAFAPTNRAAYPLSDLGDLPHLRENLEMPPSIVSGDGVT